MEILHRMVPVRLAAALLAAGSLAVVGCGSSGAGSPATTVGVGAAATVAGAGVRVVTPAEASVLLAAGNRTLIDVRTPDEFASGHLAGARPIDFRAADFADRLGDLDRTAPYVIYCQSGNRSGQARALMVELGFTDVADVQGGITAWTAAGLPLGS